MSIAITSSWPLVGNAVLDVDDCTSNPYGDKTDNNRLKYIHLLTCLSSRIHVLKIHIFGALSVFREG